MHLKYLSLCLFSFGLFGCSQHLVQETKKSNQPLDQRAINGLNAIYETPSFDFKGQVLIKNTPSSIKISSAPRAAKQNGQLDDEIKKQIDLVLKSQNIKLSTQDKNALYISLAEQSDPYGYISSYGSGESSSTRFITGLLNFLNSFEFSYDGSVHYRQKMATLNLNFQYEKPTLFVKTTIPMAVDFNQYKFYMNYFSLVPYLVNPEYQDTMAYLDFSKYKNIGEKFNFKELLAYSKQVNAVNFLLAEQNKLQSVEVSQAEKQNGTVDKIRLKTNFIDLFYQNMLFDYVNEPYVFEKILGQQWQESDEEIEVDEVDQVNASSSIYDDIEDQYDNAAIKSVERVFTFINQNLIYSEDEEYDVPEAEAEDTYAGSEVEEYSPDSELVVASEVYADNNQYDEGDDEYDIEVASANLSEQGCQALLTSKEKIPVGFIGLCRYEYDIDLLSATNSEGHEDKYEELEGFVSQLEQLQAIFKPYRTVELTDVYAFKKIWDKHQPEIQKILKAKDNAFFSVPLQVDVSLDKQGRAQSIVYDAVKSDLKYGKTHISSTTQFLNYGKATAINTSKLKSAKSIDEVSKGSLLERLFSGISAKLGSDGDIVDQEDLEEVEPSNAKIKQVVLDAYLNTGSYLKAYQAAFAMFYADRKSVV